jgi:hypothetical protein
LEKVSQHIDESSVLSADVVSNYRASLKMMIAQMYGVLDSLDDLYGADETTETESIYKDHNYRSEYWHSIEQVEFDDEYKPDLEGNFTVDDLLAIGAPAQGIKKLGSLAQFYGHTNPHTKEAAVSSFFVI